MHPLEAYLRDLRDLHASGAGVPETSGYPALSNLFNEVGDGLRPKVRCVMNLADAGAGLPDGGLYTRDQFQRAKDTEPKEGQLPARGAVEVKGPADDVQRVAGSDQVKRCNVPAHVHALTSTCKERQLLSDREPAKRLFVEVLAKACHYRYSTANIPY